MTGEAYANISGYARMSGRAQSTISDLVKLHRNSDILKAEIDTGYGFKLHRLIPADIVFEWLMSDNPKLAQAMGKAGATVYLHQLAGFKVSSNAIAPTELLLKLPPSDVRVSNLISSLSMLGIEMDNPRYHQALKDITLDILGIFQTPNVAEVWCGVAERAEQLGYPVNIVTSHRSQLGKYVKRANLEARQENRFCSGTMRPVWLYRVSEELDQVISEFFINV